MQSFWAYFRHFFPQKPDKCLYQYVICSTDNMSYGLILILQAYAKNEKNSGGQFFEKLQKPHFEPT